MQPPQPLLKVPKTDDIKPIVQGIIASYDHVLEKIVSTVGPESASYSNVMQPWAEIDNTQQCALGMVANLQYCSPSLETQDAVRDALKLWREAEARWSRRSDFYRLLLSALQKERSHPELDQESRLILEEHVREYEKCGFGRLSEPEIAQYLEKRLEIGELRNKFNRNIAQESGGIWFLEEELEGVPDHELSKWKTDPSIPDQVKRFVPFANGGAQAVLKYAHDAETRHCMQVENEQKLAQNVPILVDIVRRRCTQAHTLGLADHATFRAQDRAVKSAAWINTFLKNITGRLVDLVAKEVGNLQDFRIKDRKDRGIYQVGDEKHFPSWEQAYYNNLMRRELNIDEDAVSCYFPLEHVMGAMLGLFTTFLGLRFDLVPENELGQDVKWHESVDVFAVWDGPSDDAEFVGYLYLDLIWREHKYRGNQNVNIACGYVRPDGSRNYPSTVLSCALPSPAEGTCKLLKHQEVVTLFHELGHAIHDLLSRTKYVKFHGSNRLPVDAGEMPSMFLENFVWLEEVLTELSQHYTTLDPKYLDKWRKDNPAKVDPPKEIPKELIKAMQSCRFLNESFYYCHILDISVFDMRIHGIKSPDEMDESAIQQLWYSLREEMEKKDFGDVKVKGSDFVTFGHLVSGYDVGYYGYLACAAFAQDVWQASFAEAPCRRETWDRYRHMILEYGGAHPDKLQMLREFLGRDLNVDALVESLELGIVT